MIDQLKLLPCLFKFLWPQLRHPSPSFCAASFTSAAPTQQEARKQRPRDEYFDANKAKPNALELFVVLPIQAHPTAPFRATSPPARTMQQRRAWHSQKTRCLAQGTLQCRAATPECRSPFSFVIPFTHASKRLHSQIHILICPHYMSNISWLAHITY